MINRFDKAELRCPICRAKMLTEGENTLCCNGEKKHTYDISSSGYVNLASPKQSGGGDIKSAVKARTEFLDCGYYRPIAEKTAELVKKYAGEKAKVIDAGCGEGYYSSRIAKNAELVLGFDISKFAVEAAAKRAKRNGAENAVFAVASVFSMPISSGFADAVVNIFAPCVEKEYTRVLKDGGVLIVVHAGKDHLMGLKRVLYDSITENDARADLPSSLELVCEESVNYTISVEGNDKIKALFEMTPYYWRTSQSDAKKLDGLELLETQTDIIFSVYKRK